MNLSCTCYDGGCKACVAADKAADDEMRATAYAQALEDAALTVEAFAETKTPTFWTSLREAARRIRALKPNDPCSTSPKADADG